MRELKNVLEQAIQSIEQTVELFYQQKNEEGFKQLDYTLTMLIKVMNDIFAYQSAGHSIGIDENQLVQVLAEAMKAMEVKDTVLLSDILQYDLKELFNKILAPL